MDIFILWIGFGGTIAFAVTAVLAVSAKGIDLFGACVLAMITAVGGGTLRDLIIDVPVFWSNDLSYIWMSLVAGIVAFYAQPLFNKNKINKLMLFLDAAGISLFGILATDKVWDLNFGLPVAPILLGIVTAIGGGLVRDVLAGKKNLLMKRDIYAIPVLLGCSIYVVFLEFLPHYRMFGALICMTLIFGIRIAAIQKNLAVPEWLFSKPKEEQAEN